MLGEAADLFAEKLRKKRNTILETREKDPPRQF